MDEAQTEARREAAKVMVEVAPLVAPLSGEAQEALISSLAALFCGGASPVAGSGSRRGMGDGEQDSGVGTGQVEYENFGALLTDAGPPKFAPDKALLAGYWLQVVQGQEGFKSADAGTVLKGAGHPVSNITDAFTRLAKRKPALVYQSGRVGSGKRARKIHKLSDAGIRGVKGMLGRE